MQIAITLCRKDRVEAARAPNPARADGVLAHG
jgi:hypothetical protein